MTPAAILELLTNLIGSVEALTPEIETVVGVIKKLINGESATASDIQALQTIQTALDARVAAAAAALEGNG